MSTNNHQEPATDKELIQSISGGDETAFNQLYKRHNLPVYNYILRLISQSTVAEDILQEVFLAVWQKAAGFRGKSSVKTWVFRIAYNRSISWLRKNSNPNRQHQDIDGVPVVSADKSPEGTLIDRWQEDQIKSAIQRLSHNHRSVIELTFMHGFSYQEIAEIMKCPVGTVKSRMSYALKYIKTDFMNRKDNGF